LVIRYLVVDTSAWLAAAKCSFPVFDQPTQLGGNVLPATISKQQIKDSPSIDSDNLCRVNTKDLSRLLRISLLLGGAGLWGANYYPGSYLTGLDARDYDGYQGYWERHRRTTGSAPAQLQCSQGISYQGERR